MSLLLLDSDYNIRSELFSNNEQGLWLDPSNMTKTKADWRRNLLTYSEGTASQFSPTSQVTTASTSITGFSNSIQFGDNSVQRYAYSQAATISGLSYTLSVYVQMDDNSIPSVGTSIGSGDFNVVFSNNVVSTPLATVSLVSGSLYRISVVKTGDGLSSRNFGVLKNTGQSAKTFRVTGYQLELGSLSEYQKITDFSTEFKAAFPTHTLYQDSNGVTPCTAASNPVGLILDQSRGGLGAKTQYTLTNGSFDSGSTGWTASNATVDASVFGQLTVTGASAGSIGIIQQEITGSVAGQWWEIVADVQVTSNSGVLGFWTGAASSTVPITGTHRQTVRMITLAAGTVQARVGTVNVIGASIIVYDVKVYQVPGNHAYQSSSSARPTLARIPSSGRRNLLTRTEEFDNAAWTKNISTITANSATAPDGTTTADTLTASAQYGNVTQPSTAAGTSFTFSCYAKKVGSFNELEIGLTNANNYINGFAAMFNLNTGAYVSQRTFGTGYTLTTYSITDAGSGWYRLVVSGTISVSAAPVAWCGLGVNSANGSTMLLWGAQLETGSTATNYQKVVATTDVTESGVGDLWHLVFDGSDDSLVTNSVDMTGTAQMTVIAGVRKLSDAAIGIVAEHGNTVDTLLAAPRNASPDYGADLRHSGLSSTTGIQTYTAPISNVVSVLFDRSAATIGGQVQVRANGTLPAQNNTGTGPIASSNFTNNVIFIGRRNSASLPYNGHLYQLIIRGKTTSGSKLLEAERFAGKKTGVSF